MGKRFFILGLMLAMLVGNFLSIPAGAAPPSDTSSLLIKLVSGLSQAEQNAVINRNGGTKKASIAALRMHVVEVPAAALNGMLHKYQADPQVASAEVNKTRRVASIPSDPLYGSQWALPKIGWDTVFGTVQPTNTAFVAVLDTGVDASHPDLTGKVDPGTSVLDGSNGQSDPHGHGTWLAGIITAVTDNNTGIAGVSPAGVHILPVTVLGADGTGQDSDVVQGVVWAADHGADVILMGFSSEGFSQALQDAIDYAWSKGAVLVAATGNDGVSTPTFPAGDRSVVGVSATDPADLLAPASNYGQGVFLAAPGMNIQTTAVGSGYTAISGTSASSAIVAGVAAFMKAVDGSLTNGVIVGRMARTADEAGTQAQTGNGRINMARALADTGTEPVQPAGADPVGPGGPFVGPYRAATPRINSVNVGSQTGTLTYGTQGNVTYSVSPQRGSNGTVNGTLSVISGLPVGVTTSFSPNNGTWTSNGSAGFPSFTLTLTTSATTPVGMFTFTVKAADGSDTATNTGVLTISKASSTSTVTCPASVTYNGAAQTPCSASYTTSDGLSGSLTVSYASNTNAGTATASASYAGDANHTGSSDAKTFTIDKASSTTVVTFEAGPYTYRGTAFTATAQVSGVGGLNSAVAIVYSGDCTNVTTANGCTATATFAGDGNHAGSSDTKSITITKASSTTVVTCLTSVTYSGAAQTPCTVAVTGVGGLSLTPAPTYTNNTNVGTATASYTYAGDANHTGSNDSKTFTINKRPTVLTYTGALTAYSGQCTVAVSAQLMDQLSNTPISGVTITIAIGTQSASFTTNSSGVASGTMTIDQSPGGVSVNTSYAGNDTRLHSSDTDSFTINANQNVSGLPNQAVYTGSVFSWTTGPSRFCCEIYFIHWSAAAKWRKA